MKKPKLFIVSSVEKVVKMFFIVQLPPTLVLVVEIYNEKFDYFNFGIDFFPFLFAKREVT